VSVKRTITEFYTDDLTGEAHDSVRSIRFSLNDANYEIDLTEENAAALGDVLQPFMMRARVLRPTRSGKGKVRNTRNRNESGLIREWARSNSYDIAERGRIPREILEAYDKQKTA
jgi:hypothetical protein